MREKNFDTNLQHIERLQKEQAKLKPWGEFDRKRLAQLEEYGVQFTFYQARSKDFERYAIKDSICETIRIEGGIIYFVHLQYDHNETLPFEKVLLPENTLTEIDSELARLMGENIEITEKLRSFSLYIETLKQELEHIDNQLDYELTIGSYDGYAEGKIFHLKGWYPEILEDKILKGLNDQGATFSVSFPGPGDKVPVKLKNTGYARLFEPITRIFQLPNYYELDLTPLIAVFYPIFFAYCLGDAGYGLVVLGLSLTAWFTFLRKSRHLALLGCLLGGLNHINGYCKVRKRLRLTAHR